MSLKSVDFSLRRVPEVLNHCGNTWYRGPPPAFGPERQVRHLRT